MALTPGRHADLRANDGNQADHFSVIEEQVGVGRIVHIGFNDKGITAAPQFLIFFVEIKSWPALTTT